jgi:predicted ArsR family transcriptional regulator
MATKPHTSKSKSAGKDAPAGRQTPRSTTKRDRLVRLLKAVAGRDIATLSRTLGWQPHTTRAALTRLRQSGYAIEKLPRQKNGGSRYRIAGDATEPTP